MHYIGVCVGEIVVVASVIVAPRVRLCDWSRVIVVVGVCVGDIVVVAVVIVPPRVRDV